MSGKEDGENEDKRWERKELKKSRRIKGGINKGWKKKEGNNREGEKRNE